MTEKDKSTGVSAEAVTGGDPSSVTAQFDHLATRDPQEMAGAEVAAGGPSSAEAVDALAAGQGAGSFSPDAAALAGGNELGYGNRVDVVGAGAVGASAVTNSADFSDSASSGTK